MKPILASIAATAMATGAASAFDYSTSFSDSDSPAFTEDKLDGQNSWVAHPVYSVTDASGTGLLNRVNADGPVHLDTSADVTSELAAGETITLTLEFNFVGTFENQNNGAWILGLGNSAEGISESSDNTIGSAVFQNNSNTNFWLSPITFPNGSKFDTGISWDSDYHTLTTTITRSTTTNEFDITTEFGGQSTSFTVTNAGLWDGTDTAYAGFRFRGNQDGNVDSFSVSSSGGGGEGTVCIDNTSYETGTGVTISYTSSAGPVDVYRNSTGDLSAGNFSLLAEDETGGTYIDGTADATVDPKAFYVLVPAGESPFAP